MRCGRLPSLSTLGVDLFFSSPFSMLAKSLPAVCHPRCCFLSTPAKQVISRLCCSTWAGIWARSESRRHGAGCWSVRLAPSPPWTDWELQPALGSTTHRMHVSGPAAPQITGYSKHNTRVEDVPAVYLGYRAVNPAGQVPNLSSVHPEPILSHSPRQWHSLPPS
jgi:hypothetical protein